jgi:hypothetical protein
LIERKTLYTNDAPSRKSAPGDPLVEALRELLDRQRVDARADEVGEADARLDDIVRCASNFAPIKQKALRVVCYLLRML